MTTDTVDSPPYLVTNFDGHLEPTMSHRASARVPPCTQGQLGNRPYTTSAGRAVGARFQSFGGPRSERAS